MKNLFLSLVATLLFIGISGTTWAQNDAKGFYNESYSSRNSGSYGKSTHLITISYGFPNVSFLNNWDVGIGPIYLKYEQSLFEEIGVGGYLGLAFSSHDNNIYQDNARAFCMGAMAFYHFNKLIPINQLDVYVGAGLGFSALSYKYDNNSPFARDDSDFDVDGIFKVGARWYFTNTFSAYGEAGYDNLSIVNLGVSFRF